MHSRVYGHNENAQVQLNADHSQFLVLMPFYSFSCDAPILFLILGFLSFIAVSRGCKEINEPMLQAQTFWVGGERSDFSVNV